MHHPTDRIAHTTTFVTPVVEHWLEREIAQCVHPMKDRSDDPSHHERTLLPRSYISLPTWPSKVIKNFAQTSSPRQSLNHLVKSQAICFNVHGWVIKNWKKGSCYFKQHWIHYNSLWWEYVASLRKINDCACYKINIWIGTYN